MLYLAGSGVEVNLGEAFNLYRWGGRSESLSGSAGRKFHLFLDPINGFSTGIHVSADCIDAALALSWAKTGPLVKNLEWLVRALWLS